MIKKALYGIGVAYMGLSLTACTPKRRFPVVYGDEMTSLGVPIKMYEIQDGDTFNKIAKAYGLSPNELHQVNPKLENREHIETGAVMYIPLERIVSKTNNSN